MRSSRNAIITAALALLTLGLPLCTWAVTMPPGLTFYVSFDKLSPNADFSVGDGHSTLKANLELRSAEGVKGAGLLQRHGERCSYPIAGNLDTSQGTFSIWIKPLSWQGSDDKFRHFLVVSAPHYRMLLYLYPIGDQAVMNYIQVNAGTPKAAIWRAGAPVDIFKRNQWTNLVSTWDSHSVRLYANGKKVGEGLVGAPLPKLTSGEFTICPIDYWQNPKWSDPDEQTICDEVRIFNHALTDDQVLDLYAMDVPGGLQVNPKLILSLQPDYFSKQISLTARAAHLDANWQQQLKTGGKLKLTVQDPRGQVLLNQTGPLPAKPIIVHVKQWQNGDYTARGTLTAGDKTLQATAVLTKPPTPWLPAKKDWRADRLLPPWTPLHREPEGVGYWNGQITLPGAFPAQITSGGSPLLAAPVSLVADTTSAGWQAPRVTENKPYRVTWRGQGKLGQFAASYQTLVEFDGLIRTDLTLTPPAGGVKLQSLTIEIPLRPEVASYYRNPTCQPWNGKALDEKEFIPYAWLGNENRGLSWFMESSANWRIGDKQSAMTIRREGDQVIVRLRLISTPTTVRVPLTYTLGLEATPVRPLNSKMLYGTYFASGPQFKGVNTFVYGWGQQISSLNGRLLALDPAAQEKLVKGWRAQGIRALSYTCAQCTANISPEYKFFAHEWNQPYGATFAGYKRAPDNAPYNMVPVCPRSSFADFLVWCVKQNLAHNWGDGIYTDIDGAIPCDNAAHGCGFTDAFGRSGRTWPLYAHRALSRRIYAACHDAGGLYFAHAHSEWYAPFNAFNDGWCPGEQYSSAVIGKPNFYMDDIPDRVWRSEFYSATTGVSTFLLPELGRLTGPGALKAPGPSQCCISAAMCYGVPLWAGSINKQVVQQVWAVQKKFGLAQAHFTPFWKQQAIVCSDPQIRISYWEKPGSLLLVVTNFTGKDKPVELHLAKPCPTAQFKASWQAADLTVKNGVARLTIPAKRGALVTVTGLP